MGSILGRPHSAPLLHPDLLARPDPLVAPHDHGVAHGEPLGGDKKWTGTLELILPLPFIRDSKAFRITTFVDAGNVFGPGQNFDLTEMRASAGITGIWVSPFEVEAALISHPAVLEAGVVPAHEGDDLIKPKAFVVLQSGQGGEALYEELKDHVKERIGAWKYPRWIEFVDELPKTATGKIQRFKLRTD